MADSKGDAKDHKSTWEVAPEGRDTAGQRSIQQMANEQAQADCLAQLLRITVFLSGKVPDTSGLWHRLTGRDPEIDEHRRREGLHRQAGPHGEGELEVRILPGQIDLLMTPLMTDLAIPKPHIGHFQTESEAFLARARPWLGDIGGAFVRVAFGGLSLHPARDRAEAYGLLARYVPSLRVDAEHSKEVLYRVNRPKESRHGIIFNRITTWTPISLNIDVSSTGGRPLRISEQHFLRLEFDHSSPAERAEPLEGAVIIPIFEELLELAIENAFQGECP